VNAAADIRGFDFHCHVDLHREPARLIAQCEGERIVTVAVTTTPKAWPQNRRWTEHSRYVHAAAGLHPELVGERHAEVDLLLPLVAATRFIGEVGLDGSPQHAPSYERQKQIFGRVLETAHAHGGRVMTVHSRRAADDVIAMIERQTTPERVLTILHWFTGSITSARRAATAGCYFSVNGAMLETDKGRALVRSLPQDRILTETDSPFTSAGARKSVPWDVIRTAERLSVELGIASNAMAALLKENAERALDFAGAKLT
jgi:TatD DNase family protein